MGAHRFNSSTVWRCGEFYLHLLCSIGKVLAGLLLRYTKLSRTGQYKLQCFLKTFVRKYQSELNVVRLVV